jgi:uncharacterized protein (DUF2225 family)
MPLATQLVSTDFLCPVCHEDFRAQVIGTAGELNGKRTDFQERHVGAPLLPFSIVLCGACGFAGYPDDYTDDTARLLVDDDIRAFCHTDLRPVIVELHAKPIPSQLKYEFAARIAAKQDRPAEDIALLFLRAAWCCVLAGESEREDERYYRVRAARFYELCLVGFNNIPRDDRAKITYLVGELWRRIGDNKKAAEWFDRVPDEINDPVEQKWVIDYAVQQKNNPLEWFAS